MMETVQGENLSGLTDGELAAIALGRKHSTQNEIARLLLVIDSCQSGEMRISDAMSAGLSFVKSQALLAIWELARRRLSVRGKKIRTPEDVMNLVRHYADRSQEHFLCGSLNGAHEVIAMRLITVGLVNAAQVHPREVFSDPLKDRAVSIVVAHNHPSGELEPSRQDIEATKMIADAGRILGISLLDHLIFSHRGYVSLKEKGISMG